MDKILGYILIPTDLNFLNSKSIINSLGTSKCREIRSVDKGILVFKDIESNHYLKHINIRKGLPYPYNNITDLNSNLLLLEDSDKYLLYRNFDKVEVIK